MPSSEESKVPKDCPFGSSGCPHVANIQRQYDKLDRKTDNMQKILWILVGICAVQLGITII